MSASPVDEKLDSFLNLIYKNFKTIPFQSEEKYHFWYGEKATVIKMFNGMSFPSLADQETIGKLKGSKLLVLCASDPAKNEFYGAVILTLKSKENARLVSFIVHPSYRNKGYGTKLMQATEKLAELLKLSSIDIKYRTYWKSVDHWEKLLDKTGWSERELLLWYFTVPDIKTQFDKDWFKNSRISYPYSVEEWNDTSLDQLRETLQNEDWQGIVPKSLSPFQLAEITLPHASILLKKDEEVVGWLICHLLQPDIVQATSLFVHPEKAKGQGVALMAEASRRRKLGVQVIFMVEKHNELMLNLVRKRFTGGSTKQYKLLARVKKIYS